MGLNKSAPSAVVGIDIGTDFVKVAEAKRIKNGISITGLGIAPTPVGSVDNGIVIDPVALGTAVKKLLKDSGIKTKKTVSIVCGQSSVVVRVIEVPKMTPDELKETMKWEVERHVPFSPTDIVMDFAPIERPGTPPDAQSMEVLLAVAQQEAVDNHVKMLFAAGLQPVAIDVQPLAVGRPIINAADATLPLTVAVVNIGHSSTDVGIYEAGTLTFPAPFPIAGVNLTRAISEALGVPEEEAERLKIEYAFAEPSANPQPISQDNGQMGADAYGGGFLGDAEPTQFETAFPMVDPSFHAVQDDEPDPMFATSPFGEPDTVSEPAPAPEQPAMDNVAPAASDFSPFDFGTPAPAEPAAPAQPVAPTTQSFDIAGDDDVFDLGSHQASSFTPVFDLEDADTAPVDDGNVMDAANVFQAADPSDISGFGDGTDGGYVSPDGLGDVSKSVNAAIAPVLSELATEIRRSIEYYLTRYNSRPEQIFVCGGGAKLRGIDEYLAAELGIPVTIANPTHNLTVNCPKYSPQYLEEVSAFFPVSIGLAIREMME